MPGTTSPPGEPSQPVIEVFAPGVISTPDQVEYYPTFTPDGKAVYFTRASEFTMGARKTIMVARADGDGWTTPIAASFSGVHDDTDPFLSADGQTLYFSSSRPGRTTASGRADFDLFRVRWNEDAWGPAEHLGPQVNSATPEHSPVIVADGTLYFRSSRAGGLGRGDLYRARPVGDGFGEPENLGPLINSATGEWNCLVPADQRFIIFEASSRPSNVSVPGDLYISFARGDTWTSARPLAALNTTASDLAARLSPDGQWLYFASNRSGDGNVDIYRTRLQPLLAGLSP